MTDHADTIRRLAEAAQREADQIVAPQPPIHTAQQQFYATVTPKMVLALLAERQQAQEDAEKWEREALRCGDSLARVERERRHGETRGERDAVSMTTHEQRLYAAQEKLLTRIEQLKAERQQAQQEIEEWRAEVRKLSASWDKISAERQQAIDKLWEQTEAAANLLTEVERLEAERQQAQEEVRQLQKD